MTGHPAALDDGPLDVDRSRFAVRDKAPGTIAAGSVGPWERRGISPFQRRSGMTLAAQDREYDPFGATPT